MMVGVVAKLLKAICAVAVPPLVVESAGGVAVTAGAGEPDPCSVTFTGLTFEVIISIPLALPVAVGENVTVTVHCASTASDVGHGFVRVKPWPETCTARLLSGASPEFPIVSVLITLEFTMTLPKSKPAALTETTGAGAGADVNVTSVGELSAFDSSARVAFSADNVASHDLINETTREGAPVSAAPTCEIRP